MKTKTNEYEDECTCKTRSGSWCPVHGEFEKIRVGSPETDLETKTLAGWRTWFE